MSNNEANVRATLLDPIHVWASEERTVKLVSDRTIERRTEWRGRGAGAGAMLVSEALDRVPVLASVYGQAQPGASLLLEIQGQADLALAERQANSLGEQMKRKGLCSDTTIQEGVSAGGLLALTQWRNGKSDIDGAGGGASLVCWRAVQASMSADTFGDTIELSEFSSEDLAGSMLPLPQFTGDASRHDKASRLLFERARGKRAILPAKRIDSIKAMGGRGKRADLVDCVGRAALLMLQGETFDNAATLAGFKAAGQARATGGKVRAGDRLAQAVRRLGFMFLFTLREHEAKEHGGRGVFIPMTQATANSLTGNPSATLPLPNGRGAKQFVAKLERAKRRNARRAKAIARATAQGNRIARQLDRATTRNRAAERQFAKLGLWAGLLTSGNNPVYRKA